VPNKRDAEDAARLAARRGNGTRHNRMVASASAGSQPAEGFDVEGNGLSV